MDYKWIGAVLIVTGCGGFGFSLAANHRREENLLRKLIGVLDFMACELHYRVTPLPELCRCAAREGGREIGGVLKQLADALDRQTAPDAARCMDVILRENTEFPSILLENLRISIRWRTISGDSPVRWSSPILQISTTSSATSW